MKTQVETFQELKFFSWVLIDIPCISKHVLCILYGLYCCHFSLLLFNFVLFLCVLDYIYTLYVTGMIITD